MEWDKIKKYLIIIFIGINAFLFLFNYYLEKDRYRLTEARQDVLYDVVTDINDFSFYTKYPTTFEPMRQINVQKTKFNKEEIISQVFTEKPTINPNFNDIETYTSNMETLMFTDGEIVYKNDSITLATQEDLKINIDDIADDFASKLVAGEFKYIELSQDTIEDGQVRFLYCEVYEGNMIFSNTVSVTVTTSGVITEASLKRHTPVSKEGEKRDIYPVDEAIYNVIYYIREKLERQQGLSKSYYHIDKIEIGYFSPNIVYEAAANPCYRIRLINKSTAELKVLYVDAYTNEIYDTQK